MGLSNTGDSVLRLALIAGMAGLISSAAIAQPMLQAPAAEPPEPSSNPSTTADDAARGDPNKIICRTVRPPTGTRVSSARSRQKVCMSKADWEQQERDAQEQLRVRDSGVCAPGECRG